MKLSTPMICFLVILIANDSLGAEIMRAIVITTEPFMKQVQKTFRCNQEDLQEIDKLIIDYAFRNNKDFHNVIKNHVFTRSDLSLSRRVYRGTISNPYVIEISINSDNNSRLANYIFAAIRNNNFALLKTSYTACELDGFNVLARSKFDNKKNLLKYLENQEQ